VKKVSSEKKDSMGNEGLSIFDAVMNLSKMCIGCGILALPYATSRGGLLVSPIVSAPSCPRLIPKEFMKCYLLIFQIMLLVAILNGVSCCMLLRCKNVVNFSEIPSDISSTYAKLAYASGGWWSAYMVDAYPLDILTLYPLQVDGGLCML
jgi:Transmembrane amino acid transporter protein